MKKIICLTVLIVLLLSACASPKTEASQKAISVGTRAVKLLDDYLDGAADYEAVSEGLTEMKDQMEYASEYAEKEKTAEESADFLIYLKLPLASWDVFKDSHDGNAETYDKVISSRNEIAKLVGIKER